LPVKLPIFYEECLKYFAECSAAGEDIANNLTGGDFSKIVLWNNKAICIDGESVYSYRLADKGKLELGHLVSEDNEPIARHKLRQFNISPLEVFKLCCVIDSLPAEWRRFLRTYNYSDILQNQTQLQLNGQNVLISKAVSKTIYKELQNGIITPPTAQLKYNALFKNDDELNWKKIYIAYHIVLLWTQNRGNFNINFSTDVLQQMSSLAKLD